MNAFEGQFTAYMWETLLRLPVFLIAAGGIGWAIFNWKKASTAALAATLGCALLILASCMFPAMFVWIPNMLARNAPMQDIFTRVRWTNRMISFSWNICTAISVGALIFAVFAGRAAVRAEREKDRRRRDDDEENGDRDERIKAR
jgi:hypothetical protein